MIPELMCPMALAEPCRKGEMYLYVLEVIGHCVKVGITKDYDKRIATHKAAASAFGRELGRRWISGPHINARQNESRLKGNSPTEWLVGADYLEVARMAWVQKRLRAPVSP